MSGRSAAEKSKSRAAKPEQSNVAEVLPGLLKEYLPSEADAQRFFAFSLKKRKVHIDAVDTTDKKKTKTKARVKRITSRQKRQLGLDNIPAHCHKYDLFLPLHQLWLGYIDELFANNANALVQSQKLIKADYHGAILTVTKSKCPSYIGVTGILIQETESMLNIITKENKLKRIPKAASIFNMGVNGNNFTIYGSQIRFRASDRATRKFKITEENDFVGKHMKSVWEPTRI